MKFLCRLDGTPYEVFKPVGVKVKAKLMARAPAMKCKTNFKRQDRQEAEGTAEAEAGQRPSGRKELGIRDTERGSTCAAGAQQ